MSIAKLTNQLTIFHLFALILFLMIWKKYGYLFKMVDFGYFMKRKAQEVIRGILYLPCDNGFKILAFRIQTQDNRFKEEEIKFHQLVFNISNFVELVLR